MGDLTTFPTSGPALLAALYGATASPRGLDIDPGASPQEVIEALLARMVIELQFGHIQRGAPFIATMTTAKDYPVPAPNGTKGAYMWFHNPLTTQPTNNIQGYWSAGQRWSDGGGTGQSDDTGQAYNAGNAYNNGYVGAPAFPDSIITVDLSTHGSSLHVATPVINTVIVVALFG